MRCLPFEIAFMMPDTPEFIMLHTDLFGANRLPLGLGSGVKDRDWSR